MADADTNDSKGEVVLLSDPSTATIARASSILQRNTKLYGPMNAIQTKHLGTTANNRHNSKNNNSSSNISCWNSDAAATTSVGSNRRKATATSSSSPQPQQSFLLDFGRNVELVSLVMEFQAGFVGTTCRVQLRITTTTADDDDDDSANDAKTTTWVDVDELEIQDTHDIQTFSLLQRTTDDDKSNSNSNKHKSPWIGTALKLIFEDFTDFYGRITIYQMQVWGREVGTASR